MLYNYVDRATIIAVNYISMELPNRLLLYYVIILSI